MLARKVKMVSRFSIKSLDKDPAEVSMQSSGQLQSKTDPRSLSSFAGTFFNMLHHLHEDLDVDTELRRAANQSRLAMFLSKWLMLSIERELKRGQVSGSIGIAKIGYLRYYMTRHLDVKRAYEQLAIKLT